VRDEHDGEVLLGQAPYEIEHLAGLRDTEGRCRLVQEEHLSFPHDGAGDGDRLALAAGELGNRLADGADRRHRQRLQRLGRSLLHLRFPQPVDGVVILAAEEHVLDDVEVVAEGEILVDDLDP
jgi:hypothetical protein